MSHTLIDVGHIRWAGCCVEVPREMPTSDPRALDFALSGLAVALWALRQAGLRPRAATRTLLAFLVVLYSVFLAAIVLAGTVLSLGLVANHGPRELSAVAAIGASFGILVCLAIGSRRREE